MKAPVWADPHLFLVNFDREGVDVVLTSMGADPPHRGHIACLLESRRLFPPPAVFIVIANGDGFLMRKKGYVFMPIEDRVSILSAVRGVDHVLVWDDGTQFVDGAISLIRPDYFTKGGDRTPETFAECERLACEAVGCRVVFGVGGPKSQSSSSLTSNYR